jgi:hypothetical protein
VKAPAVTGFPVAPVVKNSDGTTYQPVTGNKYFDFLPNSDVFVQYVVVTNWNADGSIKSQTASISTSQTNAPTANDGKSTGSSDSSTSTSVSDADTNTLTVNVAIDNANAALAKLDKVPTPYPDAVNTAMDSLIKVAGDTQSTAKQIQDQVDTLNDAIAKNIK